MLCQDTNRKVTLPRDIRGVRELELVSLELFVCELVTMVGVLMQKWQKLSFEFNCKSLSKEHLEGKERKNKKKKTQLDTYRQLCLIQVV